MVNVAGSMKTVFQFSNRVSTGQPPRRRIGSSRGREHLAGALAAAITATLVDGTEPWFVRRADDHRGLRPTELGRTRLADLGWEPAADRRTA